MVTPEEHAKSLAKATIALSSLINHIRSESKRAKIKVRVYQWLANNSTNDEAMARGALKILVE